VLHGSQCYKWVAWPKGRFGALLAPPAAPVLPGHGARSGMAGGTVLGSYRRLDGSYLAMARQRHSERATPSRAKRSRSVGAESPGGAAVAASIIAMLRAAGGRITATRRATIEVLLADGLHRHFSAEEIVAEVRLLVPNVAESSIYRTLSALEELGVVTHVHLGHGPSTFHLADQAHRHLVCRSCNGITEVPIYEFSEMLRRFETVYGFFASSEHFALAGECSACRRATTIPLSSTMRTT
jgi:Fur family ferric uptake transcriptional regulator